MDDKSRETIGALTANSKLNDVLKCEDSFAEPKLEASSRRDRQVSKMGHDGGGSDFSKCPSYSGKTVSTTSKSVDFSNPISTTLTFEAHQSASSDGSVVLSRSMPMERTISNTGFTSGTHHTLLRVGCRSKVEALMTPPPSDAATLRRHVELLQLDLEAHIESEQRLQAVNQQLRDRLELYMKQNHENVERAESEFNTLHEDMEQTLDLQRRLAQRSASLEKEKKDLDQALKIKMKEFEDERSLLCHEIDKMSDDLLVRTNAQTQAEALQAELEATLAAKDKLETELQNSMDEAQLLRHEVEKLNSDLCGLIAKEKKDKILEKSHKTCLLKRFFHRLLLAAKQQHVLDAKSGSAVAFSKLSCCRRGLNSLQTAALRAKQMRLGYNRHAKACLERCFNGWRLYHLAGRKNKQAALGRQKTRIFQMFGDWQHVVETGRMSEGEENRLIIVSKRYWSTALKRRAWRHWTRWMRYWAKPLKGKLKSVKKHLENLMCRQVFALWKCFVRKKKTKRLRMYQACLHVRMRSQKWVFHRWHKDTKIKRMKSLLTTKASEFRSLLLGQKVIKRWSMYVRWKSQNHVSRAIAFRHYLHVLQAKAIACWKSGVKQQQAETRALHEVNLALARAAMLLWHGYHILVSKKKRKVKIASVFKERQLRKVARSMLLCWWEEMRWKKRSDHFVQLLASRRRQALLNNALHSWMHSTFENLLVANSKYQNDLLDAKAQYEAQKNQTTAVDVENLQLIDRLHAMSSDIAHLKITICEKERQEEDLHQSLEDTAIIQSTMRADLEQQHLQIQELEVESVKLQKKLQLQNSDDNAGEAHHVLEVEGLEKLLKNLHTQIEEKSSQLESYSKALKDTADKLEGTSDESQEQLSNAFEIAGSLRKILEDRENQFATLEGNCRRKELELGEVQRKIAASSCAFAETIETREARIRELEGILAQKQNEVQEAQQEMQDLQIALDAKESLVRKLEYEMKLKSDRDSSRTKTYVSSLSSWSSAAGQLDALAGFQSNTSHSIQMESMKHVYMQAKAALQQGISPDHCVSGYRLSAFKLQTKPSGSGWKPPGTSSSSSQQDNKSASLTLHPFSNEQALVQGDQLGEKLPTDYGPSLKEEDLPSFPSSSHGILKKFNRTNFFTFPDEALKKRLNSESSRSSNFKVFLEPVDSLHVEIQQLQARILERIKSSASLNLEKES